MLSLLLAALVLWQFVTTASTIPKLLFKANSYSTRARRFWQPRLADDPPWGRLITANLVVIYFLNMAVVVAAFGIAYALATLILWLRHVVA